MSLFCLSHWLCWTCWEAQVPWLFRLEKQPGRLGFSFQWLSGWEEWGISRLGWWPWRFSLGNDKDLSRKPWWKGGTALMSNGQQSCTSPRDCRNVPWYWESASVPDLALLFSPWNHTGALKRPHRLSQSTYLVNTRALYRNTRFCTLLEWDDLVSLCVFHKVSPILWDNMGL